MFNFLENLHSIDEQENHNPILDLVRKNSDFETISYLAINMPTLERSLGFVSMLETAGSLKSKTHKYAYNLSDLSHMGLDFHLYKCWSKSDLTNTTLRGFLEDQGIVNHDFGVIVPISGIHGEMAFVTVSSNLGYAEWLKIKHHQLSSVVLTARVFHQWLLALEGIDNAALSQMLTVRQVECLRYKAQGFGDSIIAYKLNISERTVKFHLDKARDTLKAENTLHAVVLALQNGLLNI